MSAIQSIAEYREIKGFSGYRIGNDGSVWSCRGQGKYHGKSVKWRRIKGVVVKGGHVFNTLCRDGGGKSFKQVSHMVLESFIGPRPKEGMIALHGDGNPSNNTPNNLRWGTYKENAADRMKHGRTHRGDTHRNSKLTNEKIIEIRTMYDDGNGPSASFIASMFGIHQTTVSRIASGKTWSHIVEGLPDTVDDNTVSVSELKTIVDERDRLIAFKKYVHDRLDAEGISTDPDSIHKAEGCRIGGRLDELFLMLNSLRKLVVETQPNPVKTKES
jgi:hypothetical protein